MKSDQNCSISGNSHEDNYDVAKTAASHVATKGIELLTETLIKLLIIYHAIKYQINS